MHRFSIIQFMHHHYPEATSFPFHSQCFSKEILKYCFSFLLPFLFASAGAEATGSPKDGGQVLSGEKWWVVHTFVTNPSAPPSVITTLTIYWFCYHVQNKVCSSNCDQIKSIQNNPNITCKKVKISDLYLYDLKVIKALS